MNALLLCSAISDTVCVIDVFFLMKISLDFPECFSLFEDDRVVGNQLDNYLKMEAKLLNQFVMYVYFEIRKVPIIHFDH